MSELPFNVELWNAMLKRNQSQRELAHAIDVTPSIVSAWLCGKSRPSKRVAKRLTEFLYIEFDSLKKEGEPMRKKQRVTEEQIEMMKKLRMEGKTNKRIAEIVGCGVTTVYDHVGKYSMDVRKAQEQNRQVPGTCEVEEVPAVVVEEETPVSVKEESNMGDVVAMNVSGLSVLKVHEILELQGSVCVYKIDSESEYVELMDKNGGQLAGLIDYASIPQMITELQFLLKKHEQQQKVG